MLDFDKPQKALPKWMKVRRSIGSKGIHLYMLLKKEDTDTRTLCCVIGWMALSVIFFVIYAL